MKRFTYLNGQFLVRELSDCNDLRPKTRAPRNVISMKKVQKPSQNQRNRPVFKHITDGLFPVTMRLVNAEDEPRYITRARLLRERRERERGNAAA